jgi:CRISPR-associated endonuclease/helicase Cas3
MSRLSFDTFFCNATGNLPYGYQCRLACDAQADPDKPQALQSGTTCQSLLVNIPTGLGKTAAVVLAWLWNRAAHPNSDHRKTWPRRLVYCLPMRSLVEQTAEEVKKWITAILEDKEGKLALGDETKAKLKRLAANSPVILMGGEDAGEWDIHPEGEAILIGTQDMLLSRALNRGYGMSRYRWSMHFGLLNNDCLWVMDETQLMGPGLSTACQLEAFRGTGSSGFGSLNGNGSVTWYMSATNNPDHLRTREWRGVNRPEGFEFGLTAEEKAATSGEINKRRSAVKRRELKQEVNSESPGLVTDIFKLHAEMLSAIAGNAELPPRTLVICNTVDRAVVVHALLAKDKDKPEGCDLLLLHSRFRPPERRVRMERLKAESPTAFPKGQIVVATQVIEAGVDVSSGVLWSEVAPLASLVQRLGRLNRAGEFNKAAWKPLAVVFGVGVQTAPQRETNEAGEKRQKDNAKCCLPYDLAACEMTWSVLEKLQGNASPAYLERIQTDIAASIPRCPYSLQRHELLDFFDTDANLSLGFTDVSPFVRGLDDDTDLQALWRERWLQKNGEEGTGEPGFTPDFQRDELCPVPISKALKAREVLKHGWLWRGKETGWLSMRDLQPAPGMTILLPLEAGGYDQKAGWTGEKNDNKHPSHYQQRETASDEEQLSSLANGWQSIAVHTKAVADELRNELRHLLATPQHKAEHDALLNAVPWHDVGKNHPDWQQAVLKALEKAGITGKEAHQPFAKFSLSDSPDLVSLESEPRKKRIRELRNSFRPDIAHEVASALAFRVHEQVRLNSKRDTDLASLLAEYVIMSHHGRVRKVLRDEMPNVPYGEKDTKTVRGIADGVPLPVVEIEGQSLGCAALSTECRKMGRGANGHESYTRGVLRLLEKHGPLRLAYFEALFRAADIRASIAATGKPNT